ncbi:MAG: hypothetical protein QXW97_02300 [Candidatus Pacearchaeota archaeon]
MENYISNSNNYKDSKIRRMLKHGLPESTMIDTEGPLNKDRVKAYHLLAITEDLIFERYEPNLDLILTEDLGLPPEKRICLKRKRE